MTDTQKNQTEEKIWKLLRGYEGIYKTTQPTLTYSISDETFYMQRQLLSKLPKQVVKELLNLVKIC